MDNDEPVNDDGYTGLVIKSDDDGNTTAVLDLGVREVVLEVYVDNDLETWKQDWCDISELRGWDFIDDLDQTDDPDPA